MEFVETTKLISFAAFLVALMWSIVLNIRRDKQSGFWMGVSIINYLFYTH